MAFAWGDYGDFGRSRPIHGSRGRAAGSGLARTRAGERAKRKNRELIGDARERLARIEGHLRIVQPAPATPEDNGDNREAA